MQWNSVVGSRLGQIIDSCPQNFGRSIHGGLEKSQQLKIGVTIIRYSRVLGNNFRIIQVLNKKKFKILRIRYFYKKSVGENILL